MPRRAAPRVGSFDDVASAAIRSLPPGTVATYAEIAEECGHPGAARAVGNVLARSDDLPWWRVVTSTGRLVPGHERAQAERLAAEGVIATNGRVAARERGRDRRSR